MIEKHVISLDIAKRLHELGVNKDSIFYWVPRIMNNDLRLEYIVGMPEHYPLTEKCCYGAYTASEILEIFPIELWENKGNMKFYPISSGYSVFHPTGFYFEDKKICDALANMLIYLIENKIMEIK